MHQEIPEWVATLQSVDLSNAFQMLVAAFLGGIIGYERESRGRAAGLRTNILIALSSCLFTILSIYGFPRSGQSQDSARIAAQVVSGVGFLGAGAVLQTKNRVRGMTSAASIWLVAAIGMAVGVRAYFLAGFTTFLAGAVLHFLQPVSKRVSSHQPPPH